MLVGEREPAGYLVRDFERVAQVQPAFANDELLQVLAVDELEDDVLPAVLLATIDHRHDVRMLELRDGTRLVLEPLDEVLVLVVLLVENLQGDVALEQRVMGLVDGRHPALSDDLLQLVSICDRLPDYHARKLPARPLLVSRGSVGCAPCGGAGRARGPPHQRAYRMATRLARNQTGTMWLPCPSSARPATRATAQPKAITAPRPITTLGRATPVAPTESGSANAITAMRYPAIAWLSARGPANVNRLLAQDGAERVFPDAERLVELALRDDERHEHANAVRVDP